MQIVNAVLLPEHYKSIEGIEPEALLGIVNAWTAVASLVSNLMFGNFSDRSRSRFGRRTPWIVFGAVLGGVTLFLTGMTTNPILLTVLYCLCMFGLNAMIAPCVADPIRPRAFGHPRHDVGVLRRRLDGRRADRRDAGSVFITNMVPGFAVAGVFMFLGGFVAVLVFPKEEAADYLPKADSGVKDIVMSFHPPRFSTAHDFYKAFAGRVCMLLSYQMITAYQLYIVQNYVGQSTEDSAVTISVMSTITMVVGLVGSVAAGPFSDFIGRRKVPVVVASVCFAIGIAMPWIMPTSMGMYLYAAIAGLGYGVYTSVDQALLVDVLPNKEEAGKDLGILNLATTLGQMLGPVIMSSVVLALGYVFAFPIAICFALVGCVFIMLIKNVK